MTTSDLIHWWSVISGLRSRVYDGLSTDSKNESLIHKSTILRAAQVVIGYHFNNLCLKTPEARNVLRNNGLGFIVDEIEHHENQVQQDLIAALSGNFTSSSLKKLSDRHKSYKKSAKILIGTEFEFLVS